jgi:hypothetical protein
MTSSLKPPAAAGDKKNLDPSLYAPITLGNQSEAILRSMSMLPPQQKQQQQLPHHSQSLISSLRMQAIIPSQPIRIDRSRQRQKPQVQYCHPSKYMMMDDEDLSASPRELKSFYDQATWRMYHLIQEARVQQQEQRAAGIGASTTATTSASGAEVSADEDLLEGMEYFGDEACFAQPSLPSMQYQQELHHPGRQEPFPLPRHLEEEAELEEEEEGIFQLDDL